MLIAFDLAQIHAMDTKVFKYPEIKRRFDSVHRRSPRIEVQTDILSSKRMANPCEQGSQIIIHKSSCAYLFLTKKEKGDIYEKK